MLASDEGHIQEHRILLAFQPEGNTAEAAETTRARVLGGGGSSVATWKSQKLLRVVSRGRV